MKKANQLFKQIFASKQQSQQQQQTHANNENDSDDDLNIVGQETQNMSSCDETQILKNLCQPDSDFDSWLNSQSDDDDSQYIDFVVVVGFHHQIGAQVEFVHPPLQQDTQERMTTQFLMELPGLALPDGSHITEAGYTYFMLRDQRNTFHCVSCYRQIKSADLQHKEESVSRTFVQKAVVVMSKHPLYGELRSKLQPTTEAYFSQKNFKDCKILEDLYKSANQFNALVAPDRSQYLAGLNFKKLFELPNLCVLSLIKAIMLEKRIIIYSKLASRVACCLFSLVALMPGCVYLNKLAPKSQTKFLQQRGFPLQLFTNSQLLPMVQIQDLNKINSAFGYILGTTNQMLLQMPQRLKADLILDLDKSSFQTALPVLLKHTDREKKLFRYKTVHAKKMELNGMLLTQDLDDSTALIQRDDQAENELAQKITDYVQEVCVMMAFLKVSLGQNQGEAADKREKPQLSGEQDVSDDSESEEGIRVSMDLTKLEHIVEEKALGQAVNLLSQQNDQTDDSTCHDKNTSQIHAISSDQLLKLTKQTLAESQLSKQFLLSFTQTSYFPKWLHQHSFHIAALYPAHQTQLNSQIHFENGDHYRGCIFNGQRHGQGQYYHQQANSTYTGSYYRDRRQGEGQLTQEGDQYVYDGQWHNDMRQGQGMEVCKIRGKYTGQWEKDLRQGDGVSVAPNGDIYIGQFWNGLKHGKGTLQKYEGESITGEWQKDQLVKTLK